MRLRIHLPRPGRAGRTGNSPVQGPTRGPSTRGQQDRWLRRLTAYCWRYRRNFIFAAAGAVLATAFTAAIPLIQRDIIDNVIVTHKQSIWPLAIALLAVAVANFGATFLRRYSGGRLSLDVQHDLRTEMLGALSRLDGARQDEIHTGQLVSRSISDINMIQSLLSFLPISAGQRAAVRRFDRHHAVPVTAADPGGARGRPGAVVHRAAVPPEAVPGQLVRPAAVRRGRCHRRRDRRRSPRGQGLRAGGAGAGADGGRPARCCTPPGCGWPA